MDIKDVLELVYFISGPVLVLVAILALNHIKVAKEQIQAAREISETQSRRDALRVTSEQVRHYSCDVIPLISTLDAKVKSEGIRYFKDTKVTIKNDTIEVDPHIEKEEIDKMTNISTEITRALNAIEGFAIYFISGVADEKTAYRSLSTTYCKSVRDYLPFYVSYASDNRAFDATLELFLLWDSRLEHEKLLKDKEVIEHQLSKKIVRTIKPIGTSS